MGGGSDFRVSLTVLLFEGFSLKIYIFLNTINNFLFFIFILKYFLNFNKHLLFFSKTLFILKRVKSMQNSTLNAFLLMIINKGIKQLNINDYDCMEVDMATGNENCSMH